VKIGNPPLHFLFIFAALGVQKRGDKNFIHMVGDREGMQKVDVKRIFFEKNPSLARLLPGFVYRYLRRIIHEDEVNHFLDLYGDCFGADFAHAAIQHFNVKVEVKGKENLPKEGRYIFVGNHPLGGFDGLIFMHLLDRFGYTFKVLANDIIQNLKNLGPLLLPINKHGGNPKDSVLKFNEAFDSDHQIVTFPSGFVSRRIKGVVTDLEWQKSFITKAKKHKRDVVPVHFSGKNSSFFYNLYTFRKFLGIKSNIEMFYLPDETYKHFNTTVQVTFGKSISHQIFDSRFTPLQWANKVKVHLYKIPENPNTEFTP
jgi:1-acyl-sn-glycerol-3-phosphate acyltransferase